MEENKEIISQVKMPDVAKILEEWKKTHTEENNQNQLNARNAPKPTQIPVEKEIDVFAGMKLRKINENVALNLNDIEVVKDKHTKKYYARLVCIKPFSVQGKFIEAGQLGGYVEVSRIGSINKNLYFNKTRIYENSWVGTDYNPYVKANSSFVNKGASIGKNTYVSASTKIDNNASIGDDCFIFLGGQIGKNSYVGHNSNLYCSTLGNNVYLGQNACLDTCYVGITPNNFNRYWWNNRGEIDKYNFGQNKYKKLNIIVRNLREFYQSQKRTIVGDNVSFDALCKIECGSVIGDGSKIEKFAFVKKNSKIPNNSIIEREKE